MRAWAGAVVAAAVGMLAGCTSAAVQEQAGESNADFYEDSAPPTKDQAAELAQLGRVDEAAFRPVTHDLELLRGAGLADAAGDAPSAAVGFVATHPAIFLGAAIRVDAVQLLGGETVVRASQMLGARRVLEGSLVFLFDGAGALVQVAGSERAVGALPDAEISAPGAEDLALKYATEAVPGSQPIVSGVTEPVVANGRGAFRVEVEASTAQGPTRRAIVVDDQAAQVTGDVEELQFVHAWGVDLAGVRRPLDVTDLGNGSFTLVDPTREGLATSATQGAALPGALVTSPSVDRWDGDAVDAHANAELVHDFIAAAFTAAELSRLPPMSSSIHFGTAYDGAFWDGAELVFGDGDGTRMRPLASGLDIVAHEEGHALQAFTAGLGPAGQSGALNEGIADALASLVQLREGDPSQAWIIGGTVVAAGAPALRDLTDPLRLGQPDHLSLAKAAPADAAHDDGEVHFNATIAGHAFFLMAEGGTARTSGRSTPGISDAHATRVLAHALTRGLCPTADFTQAARALVSSARTLYGEGDAIAVRQAWEAVGVLVPADDGVPVHDAGTGDIEPNDSRRTASRLALGESLRGEIADADDQDYYRFALDAPRDVQLTLTGLDTDLDLRVYDVSDHIVARSEEPGRANEVVRARALRGAYYVKVYAPQGTRPVHAGYRLELQ